jgi:beta-lactamase class D
MFRRHLLLAALPGAALAATRWQDHPEWAAEFASPGCAVVLEEAAGTLHVFDRPRAERAFSPASTFKVCNALIGLETGAVRDENEAFPWDGVRRGMPAWNQDTSLAMGMRHSTVWFYQAMARRIGMARMQEWIDRIGYGNRQLGPAVDRFWLNGSLRISAVQQVEFLRRLAVGELPVSARAQEIVRRITLLEEAPGFRLHGKTGWFSGGQPVDLGWFVGWLERGPARWVFALNMDLPSADVPGNIAAHAPRREAAMRSILRRLGAL